MSETNSKLPLPVPEKIGDAKSLRDELLRKGRGGDKLTVKERLALFDANTAWLDELQAEQLAEAKAKGTLTTRENRGWTRQELYEDRSFPRRQ